MTQSFDENEFASITPNDETINGVMEGESENSGELNENSLERNKSISGKPEYCYKSISGKPMVPDVRDFLSPQGCARMRCGRCCPYGQPAGVIPCFAGVQDSRASLEFTDFFQVINIGLSDAFDAPAADYRQFSLRCSGRQGLS